ncbi:unnamed protein product [Linum tenue]|uniref:Ubiquitin-like protease family profile domain-containing protein n=2 Tax=Linum tenue TaxID=586396 RepID=A0AAV0RBA7_9ROSI|nr:unnamed protein product [Linum tenue]
MGLLISSLSTIGGKQLVPAWTAVDAEESSMEHDQILRYALDSKLSPEEVLFRDAKKRRILRRKDLLELVGGSRVLITTCDLYIDHINKSSLASKGHFKKFIFWTTLTEIENEDGGSKKDGDIGNHSFQASEKHLPSSFYLPLPEGKINDAHKCELWCIPMSYRGHARAIVINIKEACYEYLDSGGPDKEAEFSTMDDDLPARILERATMYINCMRRGEGHMIIDFSKFELTFPPVPSQPPGSLACAIYTLRFLEEWDVDDGGVDRRLLRKFEGWDEESWHVEERMKICTSILTDQDSNDILEEVKQRAQEWQTTKRRKLLIFFLFLFFSPVLIDKLTLVRANFRSSSWSFFR